MADQTIPGTLSVTEKVGICIDNPSTQLHIASPAGDPSEALIDRWRFAQASGKRHVTVAGPLTVQSALTAMGNVVLGRTPLPPRLEVKGDIQGRGATLIGP